MATGPTRTEAATSVTITPSSKIEVAERPRQRVHNILDLNTGPRISHVDHVSQLGLVGRRAVRPGGVAVVAAVEILVAPGGVDGLPVEDRESDLGVAFK